LSGLFLWHGLLLASLSLPPPGREVAVGLIVVFIAGDELEFAVGEVDRVPILQHHSINSVIWILLIETSE